MLKFLKRLTRPEAAKPRVPEGLQVFAIGDVHGCKKELVELLEVLKPYFLRFSGKTHLVFLGDLVDRGPDSCGVLDHITSGDLPADEVTLLMGNHEEFLLDCYDGKAERYSSWLRHGGVETMATYGVTREQLYSEGDLSAVMKQVIPAKHVALIRSFQDTLRLGDYLFVHAGIRPGRALDQQSSSDFRWITTEFLSDETNHGFTVVHGHTITQKVQKLSNRIGVDTGCYRSGILSALVIKGEESFSLSTAQ